MRNHYDKFIDKTVPTEDISKMAVFVLQNNMFEFNSKFYQKISGTTISTNFAPPYASIFMDYIETEFLKSQGIRHWLWKRFVDGIFVIWTDTEESLDFCKILKNFTPSLDLPMKSREKKLISWI